MRISSHSGRFALSIGRDMFRDPFRVHRSLGFDLIIGRLPNSEQGTIGTRLRCALGISVDIGLPRMARTVRGYHYLNRYAASMWTGRQSKIEWRPGWFRVEIWGRGG